MLKYSAEDVLQFKKKKTDLSSAREAHGSTLRVVCKGLHTWEYPECKVAHPLASRRAWSFFMLKAPVHLSGEI